MENQRNATGAASFPIVFSLFICCLRTALAAFVLQFVEFVLPAVDPHEKQGAECRQN